MARPKPPAYDTEGFEAAHQARGLNDSAKKFLERKGALRKPNEAQGKSSKRAAEGDTATEGDAAPKKPTRARSSSRTTTARTPSPDAAPKEQAALGQEMPRRNRKARSLKARHFRLPLDIDAKLQDLAAYYGEATMVWVISKLIQEDWVRTRRALRRGEHDPDETAPAEAPAKTDAPAAETSEDPGGSGASHGTTGR